MEKIAYFYLKSTYFSPKTYIRFTKNGYTFHQKRIYISPKRYIRFYFEEYRFLFGSILIIKFVKDILNKW